MARKANRASAPITSTPRSYVVEDVDLKGGFRLATSMADLLLTPLQRCKPNMHAALITPVGGVDLFRLRKDWTMAGGLLAADWLPLTFGSTVSSVVDDVAVSFGTIIFSGQGLQVTYNSGVLEVIKIPDFVELSLSAARLLATNSAINRGCLYIVNSGHTGIAANSIVPLRGIGANRYESLCDVYTGSAWVEGVKYSLVTDTYIAIGGGGPTAFASNAEVILGGETAKAVSPSGHFAFISYFKALADQVSLSWVTGLISALGGKFATPTGDATQYLDGAGAVQLKSGLPISTATQGALNAKAAQLTTYTKTEVDTLVTGLLDYRGGHDASLNTFPSTLGSGTGGAIVKGDFYNLTVGGTLGTEAATAGSTVFANIDNPGQTAANWTVIYNRLIIDDVGAVSLIKTRSSTYIANLFATISTPVVTTVAALKALWSANALSLVTTYDISDYQDGGHSSQKLLVKAETGNVNLLSGKLYYFSGVNTGVPGGFLSTMFSKCQVRLNNTEFDIVQQEGKIYINTIAEMSAQKTGDISFTDNVIIIPTYSVHVGSNGEGGPGSGFIVQRAPVTVGPSIYRYKKVASDGQNIEQGYYNHTLDTLSPDNLLPIEVEFIGLAPLLAAAGLIPYREYVILGVDPNLYGGTTVYTRALSTAQLDPTCTGLFYNPIYNQAIAGFGMFNPNYTYAGNDRAIWGGKVWKKDGVPTGVPPNDFTLDIAWDAADLVTSTLHYKAVLDPITVAWGTGVTSHIVSRRCTLSGNYVETMPSLLSDYAEHPIRLMQWGNPSNGAQGCGANQVINGTLNCLNSRGHVYGNTLINSKIMRMVIDTESQLCHNYLIEQSLIDSSTIKWGGEICYNTLSGGSSILGCNLGIAEYDPLGEGGPIPCKITYNTLSQTSSFSNLSLNLSTITKNTLTEGSSFSLLSVNLSGTGTGGNIFYDNHLVAGSSISNLGITTPATFYKNLLRSFALTSFTHAGGINNQQLQTLSNYTTSALAVTGGIRVGGLFRNGSVVNIAI